MKYQSQTIAAGLVSGVAALALCVPTATAQEGPVEETNRVLQTVTVTAQQRAQNLQDVPITVQVVTAENIDTLAADNIGDIDTFIPGLNVSSGSPTQPRYSIRGISTSDFGVGTDPAVGIYVDGVYAARSGASLLAFNDVERIEVIKGPQGTLFGRNSAAGAVSITTRKPSDEFEAELGARIGEFDKRRIEGLVNFPVSDDVALRFNAVYNERGGRFEDSVTGEEYDREENWAVRGALRWDLTPNTRAILSYTHDELDEDGRPAIGIIALPDAPATPSVPISSDDYLSPFNAPIRNDVVDNTEARELDEIVLSLNHDIGDISLTSLTAYRTFDTRNRQDEDGTNRIETYFDTNNVESNESLYQEFRAAGQTGRFNWIVGTSYYDEQADQRSETFTLTDTVNTAAGNAFGSTLFTDIEFGLIQPFMIPVTLLGHDWSETMFNEGDFQAFAVFGDVIWEYNDQLSFTFGVRYTEDEKEFSWLNGPRVAPELDANVATLEAALAPLGGLLGTAGVPPEIFDFDLVFDLSPLAGVPCDNGVTIAEGVTCTLSDSWSDVSPRLVVDYKINDDILLFASFAEGYKAGGFNSVEVGSVFDNEDVDNFEVGIKSTFPDAGLRLNASAFQYTYNDKQAVRLVSNVGGSGVPQYLVETSDEEAFGVDLQVDWAATDDLIFFGNAQYIDVTFKERVTRSGLDLSGEPTGEPEWSFAVGGSYTHDLHDHGEVEFLVAHAYTGERRCNSESDAQGTCLGFPAFSVGDAQERTDIRAFWRSNSGQYQVGAFVNNVFDNVYATGVNNLTTDTLGTPFSGLTEPQTWGVDVKWTY